MIWWGDIPNLDHCKINSRDQEDNGFDWVGDLTVNLANPRVRGVKGRFISRTIIEIQRHPKLVMRDEQLPSLLVYFWAVGLWSDCETGECQLLMSGLTLPWRSSARVVIGLLLGCRTLVRLWDRWMPTTDKWADVALAFPVQRVPPSGAPAVCVPRMTIIWINSKCRSKCLKEFFSSRFHLVFNT